MEPPTWATDLQKKAGRKMDMKLESGYLAECFREVLGKLKKVANENGWSVEIYAKKYPITFIFRKDYQPEDIEQQKLEGFQEDDDGCAIPEIHMIMKENIQLEMIIPEDRPMDEVFFNKLKNCTKEAHRLFLLYWFSTKELRFEKQFKPMFDVCGGNYSVGIMNKGYQP